MADLLTDQEHDAIMAAAELMYKVRCIVGAGPSREGDLGEIRGHVHAIQDAILAQAAARAYPDRYRLLGDLDQETVGYAGGCNG